MVWHFMQSISIANNLHEIKSYFLWKIQQISPVYCYWISPESGKGKRLKILPLPHPHKKEKKKKKKSLTVHTAGDNSHDMLKPTFWEK